MPVLLSPALVDKCLRRLISGDKLQAAHFLLVRPVRCSAHAQLRDDSVRVSVVACVFASLFFVFGLLMMSKSTDLPFRRLFLPGANAIAR